jgi:hypothetical protein
MRLDTERLNALAKWFVSVPTETRRLFRLGEPPRADWVLNFNYIEHGIARFRHSDWAYAKRAQSGAIVGYMQTMTPSAILIAVNTECQRQTFPGLTPAGAWVERATTQLGHSFDRGFEISPIRLHHFWIDLRVQP